MKRIICKHLVDKNGYPLSLFMNDEQYEDFKKFKQESKTVSARFRKESVNVKTHKYGATMRKHD